MNSACAPNGQALDDPKKEFKARQRAYTNGDNDKYKQLYDKVFKLLE